MQFTSMNMVIIFWIMLFLVIVRPSHQYTYTCNSNALCGCSSNPASVSRIVGGEAAGTSTWGWAVSVSINGNSLCGGSIISSTWIVTAAHCLSGVSASNVIIYAGSNIRFSGQSRTAYRTIVHPNYVSSTKVNDIALIQLSTPLIMSSSISSICIPYVSASTLSAGEWPPAGSSVVAVGWGTLSENGQLPTNLQQVTLQTIGYSASTCSSVINDPTTQLCAGVLGGGKDTCQGDSGGPLMMFTQSQQWELIGLTSYGIGCAEPNYAGVYTRVADFQSWIATTTNNAYTNPISSNSANINPTSNVSPSKNQASRISYLSVLLCVVLYRFKLIFFNAN